jgi:periplasmic protein CpxP/Spy
MKQGRQTIVTLAVASVFALSVGVSSVWANEPGYGTEGHGGSGHSSVGGHGKSMMHNSTGQLIRHLLKHEKDLGLTAEQVTKLKDMQLNLDKTRIKSEADIQVAERELKSLTRRREVRPGSDRSQVETECRSASRITHGLHQGSPGCVRPVDSGTAHQGKDRA